MNVHYGSRTNVRYECLGHVRSGERRTCPGITAKALDDAVALQILQVLTPAGIELSLIAAEDIERERGRLDAHWQAELERTAYEVRLAERSYRAVDPENRLVARSLERQWEDALRREQVARESYNRFRREAPRRLAATELELIRSLATDIPALWYSPDTLAKERKEIVRALVERVTLTLCGNTEDADLVINWVGRSTSTLALRRPISRYDCLADFPRLRECIATGLRNGRTAAQIADQLNQEGFHPPSGRAEQFTYRLVSHVIYQLGLAKTRRPAVRLALDEWWLRDLAVEIGVTLPQLRHWIERGHVHVRKIGRRGQLVIWADADERTRLRRLRDYPRPDRLHPYPDELTRPKNRKESTPPPRRPQSRLGKASLDQHKERR